jgi:starch synthase
VTVARREDPALAIAIVHHANQYVITDGYENREGITELVQGYAAVLELHRRYAVPASLHLTGTLLEALAWHHPWMLELVTELIDDGLLSIVGGTYSENIMPLFGEEFNRRQLDEALCLYEGLLKRPPGEIAVVWLPERVWDPALAPVLTSDRLPNGGYRYVLVDDRLFFTTNESYLGSARAAFDAAGPYGPLLRACGGAAAEPADGRRLTQACRPYRIAGGRGLSAVPLSANLRYWVPPRRPEHWRRLADTFMAIADEAGYALLVYADDLEKTAGVGPWDSSGLDRYEAFLRRIVDRRPRLAPVRLDTWLERHPAREERRLEAGTFFELAQGWPACAGEDYRRWAVSPAWSRYDRHFALAHEAVTGAERDGAEPRLLALAWKHLLASAHETAWHDAPDSSNGRAPNGRAPAHWARAVASHARACLPIAAVARALRAPGGKPRAELTDLDADGSQEVLLCSQDLSAIVTAKHGGRIVYLFHRSPSGGVLSVGNPTDHWNWQEVLNRYMDVPRNHPGALADVGFEHDRYAVAELGTGDQYAFAELVNVEEESPLQGTRKTLLLPASAPVLLVCYQLAAHVNGLVTESCLSPDYYRLLREGRAGLSARAGLGWRGFSNWGVTAWIALADDEATAWTAPERSEAGHGLNLRLRSHDVHFHLLIGCGEAGEAELRRLLEDGRELLHGSGTELTGALTTAA